MWYMDMIISRLKISKPEEPPGPEHERAKSSPGQHARTKIRRAIRVVAEIGFFADVDHTA